MPEGKMMTLDEFRNFVREEADRFVQEWEAKRKENPEHYPAVMTEAQWWEQWSTWEGIGGL